MKNIALEQFQSPPNHFNCAQAVLHAYQEVTGDRRLSVADMRAFGGGRAPGGLCGALYAACIVAPDKANVLKERFASIAGSVTCREIKGQMKHPCVSCVADAAHLLQTELATGE